VHRFPSLLTPLLFITLLAPDGLAQGEEEGGAEDAAEPADDRTEADDSAADDSAEDDDSEKADAKRKKGSAKQGDDDTKETKSGYPADLDPKENDQDPYMFIGVRWRDIVVPGFMIRIFAEGGPDAVNVFSIGPEFTYRKDGLEIDGALTYADYSMNAFLFKDKDDEVYAFERVSSKMKVIYVTVDVLFEVWAEEKGRFSFLIGGGVGFGGLFDELKRNQVYPRAGGTADTDDPSQFDDCRGPSDPNIPVSDGEWCDNDNEHYGDYDEPSWANGGSKPVIVPWLAVPQFSFRYKPVKQLQVRGDVGWSLSGFFFGMTHSYGF
jgi:hypothetical protein